MDVVGLTILAPAASKRGKHLMQAAFAHLFFESTLMHSKSGRGGGGSGPEGSELNTSRRGVKGSQLGGEASAPSSTAGEPKIEGSTRETRSRYLTQSPPLGEQVGEP
jgi:hypothetical protein